MKNVVAMGVLGRVVERTEEICRVLEALGPDQLEQASALEGWSLLTVACHLRYGASATRQMTIAGLSGRAATFYPGGRDEQRPTTLVPGEDESAQEVLASLRYESDHLRQLWATVPPGDWSLPVFERSEVLSEPSLDLSRLALLRLTEVEVHGTDLSLGLSPWADMFGPAVLAQRIRRAEHWPASSGTWLFRAQSGLDQVLVVGDDGSAVGRPVVDRDAPDVAVTGPANTMIAVLLGRAETSSLDYAGDQKLIAELGEWVRGP